MMCMYTLFSFKISSVYSVDITVLSFTRSVLLRRKLKLQNGFSVGYMLFKYMYNEQSCWMFFFSFSYLLLRARFKIQSVPTLWESEFTSAAC